MSEQKRALPLYPKSSLPCRVLEHQLSKAVTENQHMRSNRQLANTLCNKLRIHPHAGLGIILKQGESLDNVEALTKWIMNVKNDEPIISMNELEARLVRMLNDFFQEGLY